LKRYELNYQEDWEKTRWLGYIFASCFSDKLKKPSDLVKFDWEKENIKIDINDEEVNNYFEKMVEDFNDKKDGKIATLKDLIEDKNNNIMNG
jgi:hypothetical protein